MKYYLSIAIIMLFSCSTYKKSPNVIYPRPTEPQPIKQTKATPPKNYPAPKVQTKAQPSPVIHIVQRGETLTAIAQRYKTSVSAIQKQNKLRSSRINVGQKLYITSSVKVKTKKTVPITSNTSIIPRTSWSKHKMKSNLNPMGSINKITVHHTTEPSNISRLSDIQYLNIIEKSHHERGMACIGYHYIIGRDGKIYQGRPIKYQGAHVLSNNKNNIGVSLIGDFNKRMPTKAQLKSLNSILYSLRKKYHLPATRVYGHKHLGKSECPGVQLEKWLIKYRKN